MVMVSTSRKASELYVREVIDRDIDVVQEIWLVEDDDGPTIWTIISAPPFDYAARQPVYEAQLAVLGFLTKPCVDFYTLNLRELSTASPRKTVIPVHSKLLWSRSNAQ